MDGGLSPSLGEYPSGPIRCPHLLTCRQKKEPEKAEGEEEGSRPTFAPRSQARKAQEPKYKDRAAIRRAGGDGEYKEVRSRGD